MVTSAVMHRRYRHRLIARINVDCSTDPSVAMEAATAAAGAAQCRQPLVLACHRRRHREAIGEVGIRIHSYLHTWSVGTRCKKEAEGVNGTLTEIWKEGQT